MNEEIDWYDEDMEELSEAMLDAKEAFDQHFEDEGLDGAFWGLKLRGYVMDTDFEPWKSIEMDFNLRGENDE